jgi:hypothetical protein
VKAEDAKARENDRIVVLCEQLAAVTAQRRVRWELAGEDTFSWTRPEGSVEIQSRDRDGAPPFEVTVFNPKGDRVEELISELVGEDEPAAWNDVLAELYRTARASALRADEIIDALITALPTTETLRHPASETAPTETPTPTRA